MECIIGEVSMYEQETQIMAAAFITMNVVCTAATNQG